ncbi:MAG: hypothetical protein AAFV93_24730, partial [Chloroflexota bacterium]
PKLMMPPLPKHCLVDDGLVRKIDARATVTLIKAPAGYGKTTLASLWTQGASETEYIAWMNLHDEDNDVFLLWQLLLTALTYADADLATHLTQLADTSPNRTTYTHLCNILYDTRQEPLTIVVDALDKLVAESAQDLIQFMVENSPPSLRWVITTRTDTMLDLLQLRLNGQLIEINQSDLAFTQEMTRAYLAPFCSQPMTSDQVAWAHHISDGWLAILALLATRLQNTNDINETLCTFENYDAHVSAFFHRHCFDAYDSHHQHFLMQTALLDTFDNVSSSALTEQVITLDKINELIKAGLPLIPCEDNLQSFRYPTLYRTFLRQQFSAQDTAFIVATHQRACAWYIQQSWGDGDVLERSLYHASFVGQDYLIEILKDNARAIIGHGHHGLLVASLAEIPLEALLDYPSTAISYVWSLFIEGHNFKAQQALQTIEPHLPESLIGEVYAIRAQMSAEDKNPHRTRDLAQHALDSLGADDVVLRGLMQLNLAQIAFFPEGQTNHAIQLLYTSLRTFEATEHLSLWSIAADLLVTIQQQHGTLREAEALCRYAITMLQRINRRDLSGAFHSQLGKILYETNRLEEAET